MNQFEAIKALEAALQLPVPEKQKAEAWREQNLDSTGDGTPSWKLPRDEEDYDRIVSDSPVVVEARADMASHFTAWRTAIWDKACAAEDETDLSYYVHELEKLDHCFTVLGFAPDEKRHIPTWEDVRRQRAEEENTEEGAECGWLLHEIRGNRNDREWHLLGTGLTPAAAILEAFRATQKDATTDTGLGRQQQP